MPNINYTKEVAFSNKKKKKQRGGTRKLKRIRKTNAEGKRARSYSVRTQESEPTVIPRQSETKPRRVSFSFHYSQLVLFFCYTHKYLHDMFCWYPIWSLRSLIFFLMGYNLITLPIALFVSEHR